MKKHLLKTVLLAVGLLLGTTSTWAETIATMGNVDEGWYPNNYRDYNVSAEQTLKLNFTVKEVKGEAVTNGYFVNLVQDNKTVMSLQPNGGFYYEGEGKGWWYWDGNAHHSCSWWTAELGYGDFMTSEVITGAEVELTIERSGTQVYYSAYLNTKNNGTQYIRFITQAETFDATKDLTVSLGADAAVLTNITDNLIGGTSIGNYQTGVWNSNYSGFTLNANSSITFSFKQFTPMSDWGNGAILELLIDNINGPRWGWGGIRPDRWGWAGGEFPVFTDAIDNYFTVSSTTGGFFDDFAVAVNDADVQVTIARYGNVFTVTCVTTCKSGEVKTQTFTYENEVFGKAENVVTVNLRAESAHLYLYEDQTIATASKTMTDAGWATYCSANALDLTGEIENLTDAYIITGGNNTTKYVYKESVKGQIVPANVGLLLEGTAGEIVFPVADANDATTDAAGNALVGVTAEETLAAEAGYVLLKENEVVAFYKNLNAFTLNDNTAYLPASFAEGAIEGAPRFYALGGETTGIDNLNVDAEASKAEGTIYNLAGQRVSKDYKGLVILNGKKVIIK